ncbi:MAG: alpha-ketoglutarate-dependent dioxygenase AlkB, partial [Moraxellaceae bacterium]
MTTFDLFSNDQPKWREELFDGAVVLRGFALDYEKNLISDIHNIIAMSPPKKMYTPRGLAMSVTTTSCGAFGWVSDSHGYRYTTRDVQSQQQWPAMPESFLTLAQNAAAQSGFQHFQPNSCLINRYEPGTRLTLHQDKNEKDFSQPIVSVSLGLPAIFLMGGLLRTDKTVRVPLTHGDVVV